MPDLRICEPWPQLSAFAANFDLQHMSHKEHSHIPFAVLLLQTMERWKATHDGQPPNNYQEKKVFKVSVSGLVDKQAPWTWTCCTTF